MAFIHSFALCRLEDPQGRIYNFHVHAFEEPVTVEEKWSSPHRWRDMKRAEQRAIEATITLERAVFVPRFTAYAVTYYSLEPDTLVKRIMKSQMELYTRDKEYEPGLMPAMAEMKAEPHAYDLAYWVEQGKLQWLDLEAPDLLLKAGPVEDFPYVGIRGNSGGLKRMRF
jgi:hypothetical protein